MIPVAISNNPIHFEQFCLNVLVDLRERPGPDALVLAMSTWAALESANLTLALETWNNLRRDSSFISATYSWPDVLLLLFPEVLEDEYEPSP